MRSRTSMWFALMIGAAVCFGIGIIPTSAAADQILESPKVDTPKKWQNAENNKDVAGLLSLLTDDVVWVTDTGILRGKAEVGKRLEGDLKGGVHGVVIDTVDENVSGDNAKVDGVWSVKLPSKNGPDIAVKGYWGASYVKSGNEWKLERLTTNTTPPSQ